MAYDPTDNHLFRAWADEYHDDQCPYDHNCPYDGHDDCPYNYHDDPAHDHEYGIHYDHKYDGANWYHRPAGTPGQSTAGERDG